MDGIYPWQAAYQAAVCETDDSLMDGRILEARAALEQRLLSPIEGDEYRAVENAEKALEVLRAERRHKFARSGSSGQTFEPSQSNPQAFEWPVLRAVFSWGQFGVCRMQSLFSISKMREDGSLQLFAGADSFESAKEQVEELGELWPGTYVILDQATKESFTINFGGDTKLHWS
jgi:hypothetical protein